MNNGVQVIITSIPASDNLFTNLNLMRQTNKLTNKVQTSTEVEKNLKGGTKEYFDWSREKPQRGDPYIFFCPELDRVKGGKPGFWWLNQKYWIKILKNSK